METPAVTETPAATETPAVTETPVSPGSSDSDILLYLPFDSDFEDYSDYHREMNASWDEFGYPEGVIGPGLYFGGDGEYLEAGRELYLPGDFTFSVWVNPERDNAGRSDAAILAKYETNHYGPYDFFLANNRPAAWISDGNGNHREVTSDTVLPEYDWSWLTYVYHEEDGTLTIYINGRYDSEFSGITLSDNDDLVTIGRQALMFEPYDQLQFLGILDELVLRAGAMNEDEIRAMYEEYVENSLTVWPEESDADITDEEEEKEPEVEQSGNNGPDVGLWGIMNPVQYIRYSANIGSRNGVVYADFLMEGGPGALHNISATAGNEIYELDVRPAIGDYICSFVFYEDKLIYGCKEAGTDGYNAAICVADPDGSNAKVLTEGINGFTDFYIQDNKIVYDYRQRAADGTLCATAYDLASGTYSTVPSVVEDDGTSWPDLKPEFYWDGYLYFQSGSDIYRHPVMTDASSAEFWNSLSSYNMRSLQGIEEGKLFFTAFQDSDGVLYSMDVDTGTVTEISRHTAAGGGDAYFNW